MTKTRILPGLDGSHDPHWQHWWAAIDPTALIVDQRDWARPTPEAWEAELAGSILQHPNSILVGHSQGAILTARILARWSQLKVSAALLVAPTNPDRSRRLAAFAGLPGHPHRVPATVVASRNDPWMSFAQSDSLAEAWGAKLVDLGLAGHIDVASGFGPWPAALALRDELAARAGFEVKHHAAVNGRRASA